MLVNPALKGMSQDDLNQRYSNTFAQYDGKLVWIDYFDAGGQVMVAREHRKERVEHQFDYTKLNVERPNTGWFVDEGETNLPFYLGYTNQRQWKRGICDATTLMYMPIYFEPAYFHVYAQAYKKRELFKLQFPMAEIQKRVKDSRFLILQNNLAVVRTDDSRSSIYFRNAEIGRWSDKDGIRLQSDAFKEELEESIPDLVFTLPKTPKIEYGKDPESLMRKKVRASFNLGREAIEAEPEPWIFDWFPIAGLAHDPTEQFDYTQPEGPFVVDPRTGVPDPDILAIGTMTRPAKNMLIRLRNYRALTQRGRRVFPGDFDIVLQAEIRQRARQGGTR